MWDSGWRALSGIGGLGGGRRLVRRNGADVLALIIDASFFDIAKDRPARIHARLAFTVLGQPEAGNCR